MSIIKQAVKTREVRREVLRKYELDIHDVKIIKHLSYKTFKHRNLAERGKSKTKDNKYKQYLFARRHSVVCEFVCLSGPVHFADSTFTDKNHQKRIILK